MHLVVKSVPSIPRPLKGAHAAFESGEERESAIECTDDDHEDPKLRGYKTFSV